MKWSDLPGLEGESLALKGFLFQARDGRWILAKEPDLKSCCVGAAHKRESQVSLLGDFSNYSTNVPLNVRGTFHFAESGGYALAHVEVMQEQGFPIWTVGLSALLLGIFIIRKLRG